MSRIASDSVALAADGIACVVYDDPAGQTIVQPRSPTAFDPRRPISGLAQRLLLASNAFFAATSRSAIREGCGFSEPFQTKHGIKR